VHEVGDQTKVNVVGVAQIHAMKEYGGVEVGPHSFFTFALDGGE
jgi:hypothetical protein